MRKKVGKFTPEIIKLLGLNFEADTPIYIGDSNIEHIKSRHLYEYEQYFPDIEDILKNPDYVGLNPSDNSIGYVKVYQVGQEYIRVAIRISSKGTCFVKSPHLLSTCNAERYIERGTLKRLKKTS